MNDKSQALRVEIFRLREEISRRERSQPTEGATSSSSNLPKITVHVKAPTPAPRLGTFTGVKPSGGGEVLFTDWKEKVEAYMREQHVGAVIFSLYYHN